MAEGRFCFGDFTFSSVERRLTLGSESLDLSSRYIDALALLLRERGRLVTKEQFLAEVWRRIPVTDEAITQCIRSLRRQLGDDAARPRFIETVPKHGYRFIAEVQWMEGEGGVRPDFARVISAACRVSFYTAAGGALAGVGGGLLYGFAAAPAAIATALGGTSMLLVMLTLNIAVGLVAGLGVGAGIAAATSVPLNRWQASTMGGMVGGFVIGGVTKLIGLDAFSLLFGRSPTAMTGPMEGALLGAVIELAAWLTKDRALNIGKSAFVGAIGGAVAGLLTPLLGGHLLGGSLNILTVEFPDARFRLDPIGRLFGEPGFGHLSELATATIEGGLFGFGVVGALAIASRYRHKAANRTGRTMSLSV